MEVMARIFSVLLFMSLGQGCVTWQSPPMPLERLITVERPRSVRLTVGDDSRVVINAPRMESGAVVGFTSSCTRSSRRRAREVCEATEPARIPVDEVSFQEVRRLNAAVTLTVVIAPVVLAYAVLLSSW